MYPKSVLILLIFFVAIITSCKKSDPDKQSNGFYFNVNALAKSTPLPAAYLSKYPPVLEVVAFVDSEYSIHIAIAKPVAGTIILPNDNVQIYYNEGFYDYHPQSGKITISSLTSSSVTGTFQFIGVNAAKETKAITNGRFHVKLTQ